MFCADDGGKIELAEYREHFSKFLEECGIENPVTEVDGVSHHKYTPHSARHTFASLMKKVSGADKDKLALIGHTSTEILRNDQDADVQSLRKITGAISFRLLPIPFSSLKTPPRWENRSGGQQSQPWGDCLFCCQSYFNAT